MGNTSAIRIGKAGEHRIMSELIMRGHSPALISVDDGIDIVLTNGVKIGVKTSLKPHNDEKNYSWRYKINLNPHQLRYKDGKPARVKSVRQYAVDFFIIWLVDCDDFYVIPVDVVREVSMINICIPTPEEERKYNIESRASKSKYKQYQGAWNLL